MKTLGTRKNSETVFKPADKKPAGNKNLFSKLIALAKDAKKEKADLENMTES